jgi:putative oxidoreductase
MVVASIACRICRGAAGSGLATAHSARSDVDDAAHPGQGNRCNIAGALLGLLFVVFGLNYFLKFIPMPPGPPEGSPPALLMGALFPTGYLTFVKILETLGGFLVAVPKTRNFGLLILGPIIVNILCFHIFLNKGTTLLDPVVIAVTLLALFLLWTERKAFAGLINR